VALVDSLLTAIVRADGDALVLHAGERPYVVAPSGPTEIAARVLTLEAMTGMLNELLPDEPRRTLDEIGAVQHELAAPTIAAGETFTVVAARGGDDIWIEIRRHRKIVQPPAAPVPAPILGAPAPPEPEFQLEPEPAEKQPDIHEISLDTDEVVLDAGSRDEEPVFMLELPTEGGKTSEPAWTPEPVKTPDPWKTVEPARMSEPIKTPEPIKMPESMKMHEPIRMPDSVPMFEPGKPSERIMPPERIVPPEPARGRPQRAPVAESEPQPAVVLPLSRGVRNEQAIRFSQPLQTGGIDRLLRIAAARGASTLYLTSQARPSIRIDGEIGVIEGESVLSEADVEALILDIIPERNRETLRSEPGTEWICDVLDVGRVRCVTFRDHRGAGGIFRMIPARAISAEQLGLSREIQGLCAEAEGLLLITGPRSSGKSTLISAFVDLINRTRSDHVITLENQIKFVHENRLSLVSQREVRGDNTEWMSAARAALRENPDVLVIEDLRSPEVATLALDAALSGHLVIGALTGHTTAEAVDRIIDQTPTDRRPKIQLGLAEALRGVVGQVLLRKSGGGRVAARELLLNTSAVANLIAEGKTSQLPAAIDSGRKHGMVPLNDALASFVQNGIVDSREAYRQASDQPGFLGLLKRQGIDTSFVERLA
jgi:twitching motility protein PilT